MIDLYTYQGRTIRCPDCGGEMRWCDTCQRYTATCCQEFGSCECC